MEFHTTDYILAYWYAEDENKNAWYCCIKRDTEGKWMGEMRYRYRRDDKIFDSEDKKTVQEFWPPVSESEESILKKMDIIFEVTKRARYTAYHDHFLVRGDYTKLLEIGKDKSYMNIKIETIKKND